jgi:hypothetical protein
METQPPKLQLRVSLQNNPAIDLQELMKTGNFKSLAAAAEHVLNCYVGPTLRGLKESQQLVEQLSGKAVLLDQPTTNARNNGYHRR